jgi:hypothetical protein
MGKYFKMNAKFSAFLGSFLFGLSASLLPNPYSDVGIVLILLGFLGIIYLAHKSAFRQHKHGLFSQLTSPRKFYSMGLSYFEVGCMLVCVGVIFGSFMGLLIKINI